MASLSVGSRSLSTAAVGSAVARDPFSLAGLLAVFAVVQSTGSARWTLFAAVLLGGAVFPPSTIAFVAGQFALIPAVAYAGLLGVVAVGLRDGPLVAGGLLCVSVALVAYLIYRVTLVRLGVVDAEAKE